MGQQVDCCDVRVRFFSLVRTHLALLPSTFLHTTYVTLHPGRLPVPDWNARHGGYGGCIPTCGNVGIEVNVSVDVLTSTSSLRNQQACPILCLPAELRNQIYGYALGGNDIFVYDLAPVSNHKHVMKFAARSLDPSRKWFMITHATALLRTCSQIRSEAEPLLLGLNVFSGDVYTMRFALKHCLLLQDRIGLVN